MTSKSVAALTDVLRQDQPEDACWPWTGTVDIQTGYGRLVVNGVTRRAHRLVYELLVGQIPHGFTVDHVCHNEALARGECIAGICDHRRCMNPAHLEAVPIAVNVLRGGAYTVRTHCSSGHLLDEANTKISQQGVRRCRICANAWMRAHRRAVVAQEKGTWATVGADVTSRTAARTRGSLA